MKEATQKTLAPLLETLRSFACLTEVRPARFHLSGSDFIHFHELPDGVVADVRLMKGRISVPVSTAAEQAELIGRIAETLDSLEARGEREAGVRQCEHRRGRRSR